MREEIRPAVQAFAAAHGRPAGTGHRAGRRRPRLAGLRAAQAQGGGGVRAFSPTATRMPETATLDEVLAAVDRLNRSAVHDGILVQSPLPKAMGTGATQRVFDAIAVEKDVDGFAAENVGLLVAEPRHARGLHAGRRHRDARARRECRSPAATPSCSAAATSSASRWRCCCCTATPPSPSATRGRRTWPRPAGRPTSWWRPSAGPVS